MTHKQKIVAVDDSELVLSVLRTWLGSAGYDVITRCNPVGTGALILRERPDLVLLDVGMPLLTGGEISHSVKMNPGLQHTVIVLHSSCPEAELRQVAEQSGADGYIPKGIKKEEFLAMVCEWLERPRQPSGKRLKPVVSSPVIDHYTLFVATDEEIVRTFRSVFQDSLHARFTDSGTEALFCIVSGHAPSLIVCEAYLPDMPPETVYRRAVAKDATWKERFVFVSSRPLSDPAVQYLRHLDAPVFQTPIELDHLRRTIHELQAAG